MKKAKFIFAYVLMIAVILCLFTAVSCGEKECAHDWTDADCVKPKTCSICQETSGAELGHTWAEATCTTPKTCLVCNTTEGDAIGHNYSPATCITPKICSVCSVTEGDAIGHNYSPATCTAPKTCSLCKNTEGQAIGHNYNDVLKCANCNEYGFEYYSGTKIPDFGYMYTKYVSPRVCDSYFFENWYEYDFDYLSQYDSKGDDAYGMYAKILGECGFVCTSSSEKGGEVLYELVNTSTDEFVLLGVSPTGISITFGLS